MWIDVNSMQFPIHCFTTICLCISVMLLYHQRPLHHKTLCYVRSLYFLILNSISFIQQVFIEHCVNTSSSKYKTTLYTESH